MERGELERNFTQAFNRVKNSGLEGGVREPDVVFCISLLGLAIIELDRTSSSLAGANMRLTRTYTWLTFVLLVVGIAQIVLLLRGH